MIYFLSISVIGFLIFLCVKEYQKPNRSIRVYFLPGLFFKVLCGLGIGWLYSQYYPGGDTFNFFEDGKKIASIVSSDPYQFFRFLWHGNEDFDIWTQLKNIQPRALFFSKLTAIGYWVSFGNYWMVAVLFSFVSYFSAWKLVEKIVFFFPTTEKAAVVAFLFFPSVVFWSSGLMKESIAMAGLFAVVAVFLKFWVQRKLHIRDVLILAIGFWLLWNLKYYFAGMLLVAMGGILLVRLILRIKPLHSPLTITLLFFLVMMIPLILVTQLHPNFHLSRILDVIIKNYEAYRVLSKPENLVTYYHLKATPASLIINIPWALISGIFQPFIWNTKSLFQFLAGIESFMVFILFVGALKQVRQCIKSPNYLLVLGTLTFIGLLATFLALSTPNLGTLVRYRVGFYPFLIFLLLRANPWLLQRKRFT